MAQWQLDVLHGVVEFLVDDTDKPKIDIFLDLLGTVTRLQNAEQQEW